MQVQYRCTLTLPSEGKPSKAVRSCKTDVIGFGIVLTVGKVLSVGASATAAAFAEGFDMANVFGCFLL